MSGRIRIRDLSGFCDACKIVFCWCSNAPNAPSHAESACTECGNRLGRRPTLLGKHTVVQRVPRKWVAPIEDKDIAY